MAINNNMCLNNYENNLDSVIVRGRLAPTSNSISGHLHVVDNLLFLARIPNFEIGFRTSSVLKS